MALDGVVDPRDSTPTQRGTSSWRLTGGHTIAANCRDLIDHGGQRHGVVCPPPDFAVRPSVLDSVKKLPSKPKPASCWAAPQSRPGAATTRSWTKVWDGKQSEVRNGLGVTAEASCPVICPQLTRGKLATAPRPSYAALINSDNGSRRTGVAIQLDPAEDEETIVCDRLCRGNTWGTLLVELLAHVPSRWWIVTYAPVQLKDWSDCMTRSLGLSPRVGCKGATAGPCFDQGRPRKALLRRWLCRTAEPRNKREQARERHQNRGCSILLLSSSCYDLMDMRTNFLHCSHNSRAEGSLVHSCGYLG